METVHPEKGELLQDRRTEVWRKKKGQKMETACSSKMVVSTDYMLILPGRPQCESLLPQKL
jgi:hypothetical protein